MDDNTASRDRLSDELRLVADGDAAALKRVYHDTADKLFGVCSRIVTEQAAAEDVLQETYLKIWNAADRFDVGRASPITWMCIIARNTALDWRRSAARIPPSSGETSDTLVDEQPAADLLIEDAESRSLISTCLDQLNAEQRDAIRSAFFDGHSYSRLAALRSVPVGTMKSWVRRGLARLRSCLDAG